MDALVMCGGRGTRLDAPVEKPLYEVAGVPMVDRVVDALSAARVDEVRAVTAPHAPDTREHLRGRGVTTFDADGEGYVADLGQALDAHPDRPILTVVADLPLLAPAAVNRVLDAHESGALTVCVPTALKDALGVSADTTRDHGGTELAPAGLNIVGEARSASGTSSGERRDPRDGASDDEADETHHVAWDARLAVNVNYEADAAVAEVLARGP